MPGVSRSLLAVILLACSAPAVRGAEITVAVASNFAPTARVLAAGFESGTDHRVVLVAGSSGKLFAQIVNGAPFDVLMSADAERPQLLEQQGYGLAGTRFTYALGELVLWSGEPGLRGKNCMDELRHIGGAKLAIANPRLAPYGAAAKDFLEAQGLWDQLQPNLVIGENISQALQFAASGGALFGLVAASQLALPGLQAASCAERIAHDHYTPIRQQVVLLRRAEHKEAARRFLAYLQGADAQVIIEKSGYGFEGTTR